jgi:hypothetical protein
MKCWTMLVVLLYFLILIALTAPMTMVAFYPGIQANAALEVFRELAYWAGLGVMLAGQAVMLLVPVDLALGRPTTRRSVLWPVLASGLMVGLLGVGVVGSIDEFIRKEKASDLSGGNLILLLALILAVWGVWSILFYRTGRDTAPMDVITKQCRYLLRGSVLELLVAVPTHIVARARNYCCAGFLTFLGITFGVAVMLFSFGPGAFFLFVHRWKRLYPHAGGEAN